MNRLHVEYSKFSYVPSIEEQSVESGKPQDVAAFLRKLKEDRAEVLKGVSQALDACQQLLNKITDFNFSIDSRQLFLKRDVDFGKPLPAYSPPHPLICSSSSKVEHLSTE